MKDLNEKQAELFEFLKSIQEQAVVFGLSEYKGNNSLEQLLYDVSYEVIYRVMELIDGYATNDIKIDLVDKETGISIRKNIQLHDTCADYLRYSK